MALRAFLILAFMALLAPAAGAEELYAVSSLHVDANGASSTEASNAAIAQGRVRAFQIVYRRLTRQADWAREPALDTAALTRLSRGFTVTNERRSTTRYVADVTYIFNPDAVARLLRANGIAYSQTSARRILVVAMAPGTTHGPWAQALASPALKDSLVPFALAAPDDDATLGSLSFENAGWGDVAAAAGRVHAVEAALVQAVYSNGKVVVNIRRLGINEAPARTQTDVPMMGTAGNTYPAAAQAAISAIEDLWKARTAIDYSQRGHITADVRLASLAQWGQMQSQLSGISNITGVQLVAMNTGYARLTLAYTGSPDQLREAMGGAGLNLASHGGQWMLSEGNP